jgi:pilus assembly protein Flp/PilA
MKSFILGSFVHFQNLLSHEEGQDLVEYALVVALIALGSVAALNSLAGAIATEFGVISTTFANAI